MINNFLINFLILHSLKAIIFSFHSWITRVSWHGKVDRICVGNTPFQNVFVLSQLIDPFGNTSIHSKLINLGFRIFLFHNTDQFLIRWCFFNRCKVHLTILELIPNIEWHIINIIFFNNLIYLLLFRLS